MADKAYQIRSIARLLDIHDDGDTQALINQSLAKAMDDMVTRQQNGEKAKAKLVITIDLECSPKDVTVALSHELKLPKRPTATTSFFLDDEKCLSTQNPRQREMFGGRLMNPNGNTAAG